MLKSGLVSMLIGMSVVFIFIIIMIFLMFILGLIDKRFPPEKTDEIVIQKTISLPGKDANNQKEKIAAITAALIHYRNRIK
ncbi:MAG: OadG family transporter subunit [Thermodesulfobacteriota bacterium]|nr:OadG family transporter subunit [Thermodesulfobacteriota bacterium]